MNYSDTIEIEEKAGNEIFCICNTILFIFSNSSDKTTKLLNTSINMIF